MRLLAISVENFKNCAKAQLSFAPRFNGFAGPNGAGKTNLLDAIYFLSAGKSYFNAADSQLILGEENYFSLKCTFSKESESDDVMAVLMRGRRKVIKRNDAPYTRLVDHYGEFPAIMISPGDMELIAGGSEERRRWLDSTISLHDREYLLTLIQYDKILEQRNAELRKHENLTVNDYRLLEVYDEMLAPIAEKIFQWRTEFISEFSPFFEKFHSLICHEREHVYLRYGSQLQSGRLSELFRSSLKKDVALQRTTAGIHRDDLVFEIEANPLKRFGSQGQQKTFLLALKLAQHQYTKNKKGFAPLLLLDDVCERLDDNRLETLFSLISSSDFGQVFVTDTSMQRIMHYIRHYNTDEIRLFNVENGIADEAEN